MGTAIANHGSATTRIEPEARPSPAPFEPSRFLFDDVDWDFYEKIDQRVSRHGRATFDRGRMEIVELCLRHECLSRFIYSLICVLAEETDLPMRSAGAATLRLKELSLALQGDEAFYFGDNVQRIQPRIALGSRSICRKTRRPIWPSRSRSRSGWDHGSTSIGK